MTMNISFERVGCNGHFVNVHETASFIMGFTETGFLLEDLPRLFSLAPGAVKELKQTHSNRIHFSSGIAGAAEGEPLPEGDGIILDERMKLGVIKTADCTPLFFWDDAGTIGGVLHIGWRGLLKGIEKKALELLTHTRTGVDFGQLKFLLGPAIEQTCYEVGPDLYEMFVNKGYRDDVFLRPGGEREKYLMDVKRGVRVSLNGMGIPDARISDTMLCTFCEGHRFPSYRRMRSGGRIYSFLVLK
ncbi:MAG: polyphenol oxidase family protein [bacterium]|nr:polyphenol oxidase family protein [bacterium]